jgi:hypothetical protein
MWIPPKIKKFERFQTVLTLLAWRFRTKKRINNILKIRKQQHQEYVINNPRAYCLNLQRTNKSQICNLIIQYNILKDIFWFVTNIISNIKIPQSLRQKTDKGRKDYQEYHDMAWSYTRCWTLIGFVSFVNYVKWQRSIRRARKMGWYHPADSGPWLMVCLDLVGPLTLSNTHSLLALTMLDSEPQHRNFKQPYPVKNKQKYDAIRMQ